MRCARRLAALLLLALSLAPSLRAQAVVREETIDGLQRMVLENEFIRAVFTPSLGGECTDLIYKPDAKRLMSPMSGGLTGCRVWNYADNAFYWQWQRTAWDCAPERRPGEAALVLSATGSVEFAKSCRFEKRVTLRDGESILRVTYGFHVGNQLMTPRDIGLWFSNKASVPGGRTNYFLPLDDGIMTIDSGGSAGTLWQYGPSRGWVALVGESGVGLSFNMEYRRLMCFYAHAGAQPTIEWAFRSFEVPNGETFSTEELIVPFAGLPVVHGSGGGVVAAFTGPDKADPAAAAAGVPMKARLTSGAPLSGLVKITARRLPDGEAILLATAPASLRPGAVADTDFTFRAPQPGTWLLSGLLLKDDKPVMDFIKVLPVGDAAPRATIAPSEKRLGRENQRFQDRKPFVGAGPKDLPYAAEIETPHVKWAKPLPGGKLRVLFLTCCYNGREAAELAQRLDMDIVWVTAGRAGELGRLSDLYGRGVRYLPEHMNQNILNALAQPLDVVIIGGLDGNLFSEPVLDALTGKVSDGVGLVYVSPAKAPEKLCALLPVKKEKTAAKTPAPWRMATPHFITAGVPFEALPPTGFDPREATGDVLATIDRAPLIAVQDGPGKGRVVVFNYGVSWLGGVTPWIDDQAPVVPYWEYHLAMLAKAAVWAAHRTPEPQLIQTVARVQAARPELLATFRNTGKESPLSAELLLRDSVGREEWRNTLKISVSPGDSTVTLPLPPGTGGGLHVVEMIFRDPAGASVAWGAAALNVPSTLSLSAPVADKRAYLPGDTIQATVTLTPAQGAPAAQARVAFTLTDALGRLLDRSEQTVALQGETRATAPLKFTDPLVTTAVIRVEVRLDDRLAAVAASEVITFPPRFVARDWGQDWPLAVWGVGSGSYGAGGRRYLANAFSRRLKDLGVTITSAAAPNLTDVQFEDQVRLGFQIMPLGAAFGYINDTKPGKGRPTFAQQLEAYNKTHDRKYLERPVCLNDPKDLDPLAEKLSKLGKYAAWLLPVGYNLGDEMSVTDHVAPFDYDFSPVALKAFRDWLRTRYASLADLNARWKTDFKSWDDVMPMTARDVNGRGNYAPWADHREFMDLTFANFFRWVRDQLRREDPGARVGLSGSQSAEAYGGYEWPVLAQALGFAQTYIHGDTIIMHRSFCSAIPCSTWLGYGAFGPGLRATLWSLLFNGNQGNSYWATEMIFYPDLAYGRTAADMAPIVREFQSGIARLLKAAPRAGLIGMHYSHPSVRAAFISGAAGRLSGARSGWAQVASDLGFQCEMLSAPQIEAGELRKRAYPAFILPHSTALSDKEAAEFRRYVEDGGLLIADGKIGLLDEHCASRAQGALDDLFGVARPAANPLIPTREGPVQLTQDLGDCRLKGVTFDDCAADPDITLAGGQALGSVAGAPAFVVRRSGKGVALLTNFFLDSYPRRCQLGIDAPLVQVARGALALAAVRPAVSLRLDPEDAGRSAVYCYEAGETMFAGVLVTGLKDAQDVPATLTFPREGFLYDVREGRLLGQGRAIEKRLRAADGALFALLPAKIERLTVTPEAPARRPGELIRYRAQLEAQGKLPGLAVFRVEIVAPDGQPRSHYNLNLTARDSRAEGAFQSALNDTPGRWTIRITDLVTRVAGSASVELKP